MLSTLVDNGYYDCRRKSMRYKTEKKTEQKKKIPKKRNCRRNVTNDDWRKILKSIYSLWVNGRYIHATQSYEIWRCETFWLFCISMSVWVCCMPIHRNESRLQFISKMRRTICALHSLLLLGWIFFRFPRIAEHDLCTQVLQFYLTNLLNWIRCKLQCILDCQPYTT